MVFETESVGAAAATHNQAEPANAAAMAPHVSQRGSAPNLVGANRDQVLLQLQQTHGNAYVQRMLRAESEGANAGRSASGPTEAEVIAKWNELCADKMFDEDDWKVLSPMLAEFTGRISALSELMLATSNVDFDNPDRVFVACRSDLYGFLRKCGYRMPDSGLNTSNFNEVRKSNRFLPAPNPAEFGNSIAAIRKSGALSADDFVADLQPAMWRMPHEASALTKLALELYCDASVSMDASTAQQFARILRNFGYGIDVYGARGSVTAAQIEAQHIRAKDPQFERMLQATGRSEAKDKTRVAVFDGGFDLSHTALQNAAAVNTGEIEGNNIDDDGNGKVDDRVGFHFISKSANLDPGSGYGFDMTGHGNAVLGITTKNTDRIEAVCVGFSPTQVAQGIDYAVARGARVINCSFHLDEADEVAAFRAAIARYPNVLFVQAAGNKDSDLAKLPPAELAQRAPAPNLLEVGATNKRGTRYHTDEFGSNWSKTHVDLAADATTMTSTSGDSYNSGEATSEATPLATNTAAKCLAIAPTLSAAQVRQVLRLTVDASEVWRDLTSTGGILNPSRAMQLAAVVGLMQQGKTFSEAAEAVNADAAARGPLEACAQRVLSGG
jgi:hypothetical protein